MEAGQKMTPSPFQKAVFQAFDSLGTDETIQINAVAGSGKTSTLMMLLGMQPQRTLDQALVCAFNKEIADNLTSRVPQGVTVKTIHALGMAAVQKRFGKPKVEPNKYRKLLDIWLERNVPLDQRKAEGFDDQKQALFKAIHFVRVTLTDPKDTAAVIALSAQYDFEIPFSNLLPAIAAVLDWGVHGVPGFTEDYSAKAKIDFDDMIWLPNVCGITPEQFKVILVDECQDLSKAQLDLLLSARGEGGRMVFVGDPKQAIYGFAGADGNSFSNITTKTNALELPLSICYRCPRSVLEYAQKLVPQIQPADTAESGLVEVVTDKFFTETVTPRDMILCRVTAPLIETAFWLIRNGKKAKVKGRDVGAQLVKIIDYVEKMRGVDWAGFEAGLNRWRENELRLAAQKSDNEALVMSIEDRYDSVLAVLHGALRDGATSIGELRSYIQDLFTDDGKGIVLLSTIHRAKGLEAETVYLLRPEKLPHPMAKSLTARAQEDNLLYVAITRAMKRLYVVETPAVVVPDFWQLGAK
jgi:superfamily I DNA/RNA helicase